MKSAQLLSVAAVSVFGCLIASSAKAAAPLAGVASVDMGGGHACAVTTAGVLKCWGSNVFGQLGLGHYGYQAAPVTVPGLESGVASVSASDYNTCVVTTSGAAKCWGFRTGIGDGTDATRNRPADVLGLGSGVTQIVAGVRACALTTSGGIKCWGARVLEGPEYTLDTTPIDVPGFTSGVVSLDKRGGPCAVMADGTAKCWDRLNVAQAMLGAGVAKLDGPCALMSGGTVKCWGENTYGEVGDGTTTRRPSPVDVVGLDNVVDIGTGWHFACALTSAGAVKCWGFNKDAQLGDGTLTNRSVPTDVPGLASGVVAIDVGNSRSCALMDNTQVRCWGSLRGSSADFMGLPPPPVDPAPSMAQTVLEYLPQAIDFPLPGYHGLGTFTLAASASSGLPVTLEPQAMSFPPSDPTAPKCSVSGNQVTATAYGLCMIKATQAGDATYMGAPPVTRAFVVWDESRASKPRLTNISARARVDTGLDLIGGFIIGGGGNKSLIHRARGPSLAQSGLTDVMAAPIGVLYEGQTQIGGGEWSTDYFEFTASQLGYGQIDAAEWSYIKSLPQGAYTTVVSTRGAAPGRAIVELFEIDNPDAPFMGMSARAGVGTGGDVLIGGFVVSGEAPLEVVVRARGPSLAQFGVPNVLANPVLQLFDANQVMIASNDDWATASNFAVLAASGFAPADASEAALLITLPPGAYTAIVSGAGGTTGNAIWELFAR